MKLRWILGWHFLYPIVKVFLGFRTEGRERLKKRLIIAANHTSNLDPIILGLASKHELFFPAKVELFRGPKAFAWLIKYFNAFPLHRSVMDIEIMRRFIYLLKRGMTVAVFPEGTRNRSDEFLPFKPGVALLAIATHTPVVPTYIYGIAESFLSFKFDSDIRNPTKEERKQSSFIKFFLRKRRLGVRFGFPVDPKNLKRTKENYLSYTKKINKEIKNLKKEVEFYGKEHIN